MAAKNQQTNSRLDKLEQLVNSLLNNENMQIKTLQDKVEKLEEQAKEYQNRIKILEEELMNLRGQNSKGNDVKSASAFEDVSVEKLHSLDSQIIDVTNNSQVTQLSDKRNQERFYSNTDTLETANNQLHVAVPNEDETINVSKNNKDFSTISSSSKSLDNRTAPCQSNTSSAGRSIGTGNYVFTRWMNSPKSGVSIWSNEYYREPLLSYIAKTYGQKEKRHEVLRPLEIGFNQSDELDQLYDIIKKLEEQPGAKESLREWRLETRSNHRLNEIRTIFEYNRAYSSSRPTDLNISLESNLTQIINRESVQAYFDMICRNGLVTDEIGQYLNLNKENIFGGDTYDSHNQRITFVNVNLDQSTIDLGDNRVDLVTCLVTLHHVPHLQPMLQEIVRILRPDGYLILREHDCENVRSLEAKYLNFVHAFMIIAGIGEFANVSTKETMNWEQQKANIIKNTSSIQYRTRAEWTRELKSVGFHLKATLDYDPKGHNPQKLYYAVYQLHNKKT